MKLNQVVIGCFIIAFGIGALRAENWPRYRGESGTGISYCKGIPTTWSSPEWVTDIPGEGHSSPAIWGEKLFLTSATDGGSVRSVYCLNATTGKIQWSRSVGFNQNPKHAKNSFASSSPATDGERVYLAFADEERFGLAAYDLEGQLVWRNWLGPYLSRHGQGASPIVFQDLVIIPNDQDGPSSIVAFDRKTGETIWSSLRSSREASYSTPLIIGDSSNSSQMICASGATGLTSLNPLTGDINWYTSEFPQRTVASPTFANGMVIATCGSAGKGVQLLGVDPNATGAVQEADIRLRREKDLPYVPAIVGWQNYLFLWADNGVLQCLDLLTGKPAWQGRVGGNFSGSPVCIDGKLYCIEESGKVVVVNAGSKLLILGKNDLQDPSYSTPAVANNRLYLRSFHKVTSIRAEHSQ